MSAFIESPALYRIGGFNIVLTLYIPQCFYCLCVYGIAACARTPSIFRDFYPPYALEAQALYMLCIMFSWNKKSLKQAGPDRGLILTA